MTEAEKPHTVTLELKPETVATFGHLPHEYFGYAVQWAEYETWSVEETANLLAGCVPHRPLFLKGTDHADLDDTVITWENRVRLALKEGSLVAFKHKRYFARTFIKSQNLLDWVDAAGFHVPEELRRAFQLRRRRASDFTYTTPCLEAVNWTIHHFWEGKKPDQVPPPRKIIKTMRREFPELDDSELEMVEHICRHPTTLKTRLE